MIFEGNILTLDKNDAVRKYLVTKEDRIAYVGNELPENYKGMKVVHLGEKALLPAFVDSHQHFASFSTFYDTCDNR